MFVFLSETFVSSSPILTGVGGLLRFLYILSFPVCRQLCVSHVPVIVLASVCLPVFQFVSRAATTDISFE